MNDPIINAKASKIVEAIKKHKQIISDLSDESVMCITGKDIHTALASLGGEPKCKDCNDSGQVPIGEEQGQILYSDCPCQKPHPSEREVSSQTIIDATNVIRALLNNWEDATDVNIAKAQDALDFIQRSVPSEREVLEGKVVKLGELDAGKLFRYNETIALKSEYITEKGAVEAFIVGSGEMFWGGTTTPEDQVELEVLELADPCTTFWSLNGKNITSNNSKASKLYTTPFSIKFPNHKDDDMYLIFWTDDSPPDIAHLYKDTGLNGVLMRINGTNAVVNVDLRIIQRKLSYEKNKIIDGFEMRKMLIRFVDYYNARYSQEIISHAEVEEYILNNKYKGGLE